MTKKIFTKRKIALLCGVFLLAVGGFLLLRTSQSSPEFTFDTIEKGDLLNSISCTGTLEPVGSVDVGTELSGTVSQVLADFNDDVKKGQILAILDTTLLHINLQSAIAAQIKAETDFKLNKLQYSTDKKLYKQKVISELELLTSEKNFKTAKAELISAKTNVQKIKLDIAKYSIIRSPIDGKVIDRSIEAGQTVAASLSAPTLFSIAKNLANMEIYAKVDESDIGQIKKGMRATFSVEAFPEQSFSGIVKQIRLQPETISNVVNYTVIVDAQNDSGLLLPGMTATLDFTIEEKKGVFYVSSYNFDFSPNFGSESGQRAKRASSKNGDEGWSRLWCLDDEGRLTPLRVKKGMTCGTKVEIYGNEQIAKGKQIISKQKNSGATTQISDRRRQRSLF